MMIGVCGFGYSGSGAVRDYLWEVDSLRILSKMEFAIVKEPDGLMDLEYHLCKRKNHQENSSIAIHRFDMLMKQRAEMGIRNEERRREFLNNVEEYLNSLTQVKWTGHMSYWYLDHKIPTYSFKTRTLMRMVDRIYDPAHVPQEKRRKLLNRVRRRLRKYAIESIYKEKEKYKRCTELEMSLSISPEDFLEKSREFLAKEIDLLAPGGGKDVIIDQPFPPDDPASAFHFFQDPKAIIVWRDPRDMFALHKNVYRKYGFPIEDVEAYVKYFDIIFHSALQAQYEANQVLNIRFEDMIYEYDATTKKIDDFLGLPHVEHSREKFNPDVSRANTRLYERYPEDAAAFAYIEEHMKEFLYPFEKYPAVASDAQPF